MECRLLHKQPSSVWSQLLKISDEWTNDFIVTVAQYNKTTDRYCHITLGDNLCHARNVVDQQRLKISTELQ